jgi:transposase, IS30 family
LQAVEGGYSPDQIAGRLTLEGSYLQISHESIYRFIWHKAACGDRSWSRLLASQKTRRGHRKYGGGPTMNSFTDYVPISERPAEVADRSIPGHWEADLMAFRQNSQFLLVAHERASRRAFIHKQPDKTAIAVRDTLTNLLRKLPKSMRKTITYDNPVLSACLAGSRRGPRVRPAP